MKVSRKIIAPVLILIVTMGHTQEDGLLFDWKNGAKAAIVLTYDDGMKTHIDNAIPQLDSLGFKGTFFINTTSGQSSAVGWKRAALNGHELGNHSLFHPCPGSMGWEKEVATENYSSSDILNEIAIVNDILKLLNPNVQKPSYAYPCNNTQVGGHSYIAELKQSGFISYARGGEQDKVILTDFGKDFDSLHVPSWAVPDDTGLEELVHYAEMAKAQGGLAIFQFHGVGGQWLKVSSEAHRGLLKHLKENDNDFWVATFSEVMDYVTEK